MNSATPSTDPALWIRRPAFGVAGGPIVVILSDEGNERAWSIGARVRRGPASKALEALRAAGGRGLLVTWIGTRGSVTDLGRFDEIAWGHLRALGYVERDGADGIRLTDRGTAACLDGDAERARLLARCERAASQA